MICIHTLWNYMNIFCTSAVSLYKDIGMIESEKLVNTVIEVHALKYMMSLAFCRSENSTVSFKFILWNCFSKRLTRRKNFLLFSVSVQISFFSVISLFILKYEKISFLFWINVECIAIKLWHEPRMVEWMYFVLSGNTKNQMTTEFKKNREKRFFS